jgi:beta-galactosidase/beta-glucuronidase
MECCESLDGWWHAYFDTSTTWQLELATPPIDSTHVSSANWQHLDDHKESVRVPGIWRDTRPGFCGVVWYWRPFVVPADWNRGGVSVHFEAVRGRAEVYLDKELIGNNSVSDQSFACNLGIPSELHQPNTLTVRVAHFDDSGGICGPVTFVYSQVAVDKYIL